MFSLSVAGVAVGLDERLRLRPDGATPRFVDDDGRPTLACRVGEVPAWAASSVRWGNVGVAVDGPRERYSMFTATGESIATVELDLAARTGRLHQPGPGPRYFGHPLDRFVFARLLAERGRPLVHAAAIARDGVGLLCGGASGAGKTTLANLAETRGLEVLSDERVVVGLEEERQGETPLVWGTPWPGQGGQARPGPARLVRLLFLAKDGRNELRPLSPGAAAARLLALSTIPYWSRAAVGLVVEGVARLVARVPAAELRCTGDGASIDFLEELLRS